MNKRTLLVEILDGRLFAAAMKGAQVEDLYIDAIDTHARWASLYLGTVQRIDQKLDAAFVNLGEEGLGFLQAKHVRLPNYDPSRPSSIGDLLKAGQKILVQIKSEANPESAHERYKLPRLTMQLYIPGQSLIFNPTSTSMNISKNITSDAVLSLANKLKTRGGWIIQPSAQQADGKTLVHEANTLLGTWREIGAKREANPNQERLLMPGPNAFERALLDYGTTKFDRIEVADKTLLQDLQNWSKRFDPALAESKKLRLFKPDRPGESLLDMYDALSTLEQACQQNVPLSAGGNLIIEKTHAFCAIDVNRGSADNIVSLNMAAAEEAVRQIYIRNISGAILIDFVAMKLKSDRARLLTLLSGLLQDDRGSAQVHGFTRLGIVELTRKRRTGTLAEKLRR